MKSLNVTFKYKIGDTLRIRALDLSAAQGIVVGRVYEESQGGSSTGYRVFGYSEIIPEIVFELVESICKETKRKNDGL